jgi:lysozyme family protein
MKNNDDYKKFKHALKRLRPIEGGLVDDPNDAGGITNHGISLRTLLRLGHIDLDGDGLPDYDFNGDGAIDENDIRDLSNEDSEQFYYQEWWLKNHYGDLPETIRDKVFDFSINMGPRQAHKLLQRAIKANGYHLAIDGIIGRNSKFLIKACDRDALLSALRSEAAGFYRLLAAIRPKNLKFLEGWLVRAYL